MNKIDKYFDTKAELCKYFGLYPDWLEFPFDDCREMYWKIDSNNVYYAEKREYITNLKNEFIEDEYYRDDICTKEYFQFWTKYWLHIQKDEQDTKFKDEIYTQRFYKKWIYRTEEFTLIFCDPHVDNCRWWRIFDNKKEVKNDE